MGVKKESKKLKVAAPKPVEEEPVVMDEQADEGDQVDQDEAGEWGDNDRIEDTDMDAAEGEMDVDETDPNKLREEERQRASRQEQRQLLKERKTARPNGALVFQLKKLWETIRQKRISPELRAEKMAELMGLITGKIQEVTFRHDAARVIQSALKHGSSTQREIIAQELKGKYAVLACSQYGRFIVSKILNMCPKHRPLVLKEFQGQVRKLMRHRDASFVIEEAYSQFANAQQRNSLMEEFYGPEYALFKADKAKSLQAILTENPEKKQAIIKNIRETISSFLEKGAANIGPHTILHRLILDYLLLLPTPSATASKPTESAPAPPANPSAYMVDLLKDHLIHILHTREGSRVAQLILLHATPKDRKHILKSFKGLLGKIAREQHGHTVLLELCSCVDDTVLVSKTVLMELFTDANPGEAMRDPYASRVVLFLLVGRSRRYLVNHVADELEAMDGVRKLTSKKADDVRRKEIVATLSPVWLDLCTTFAGELLRSRSGGQVLVEILKHAEGDKTALIEAISSLTSGTIESHALVSSSASATPKKEVFNAAKKLATEAANVKLAQLALDSKENPDLPDMSSHVLVDRNSTFTLKEMISGGRVSAAAGSNKKDDQKAEEAPLDPSCGAVGIAVATVISKELEYWLRYCATSEAKTSGTTFVLLALFESRAAGVQDALVGSKKGRKKAFSKLVEELSKVAVVVPKEVEKEAADENAGGKRKRGGGKDLKKSAGARQSVIHIFLNKLKESF